VAGSDFHRPVDISRITRHDDDLGPLLCRQFGGRPADPGRAAENQYPLIRECHDVRLHLIRMTSSTVPGRDRRVQDLSGRL
jgi:hypothetical protein